MIKGAEIEPIKIFAINADGDKVEVADIGYRLTTTEKWRTTIYAIRGPMPSPDDPHRLEVPMQDPERTLEATKVIRRWVPDGLIATLRAPFVEQAADRAVYRALRKKDPQRYRTLRREAAAIRQG